MAGQTDSFITYCPAADAFQLQPADIYPGITSSPGGPSGTARSTAIAMRFTGTFMEGLRNRINAYFGYSHIGLVDPDMVVHDMYQGSAVQPAYYSANPPDFFAIPTGQTSNYWVAVFSFVTVIPGLGKQKVVLLDRWSVPGNWSTLL